MTISILLLAALPARAQEGAGTLLEKPKPRQGYYLSLGAAGAISYHDARHQGWLGPWPEVGGALRVGQAILPWLDVGLDIGASGAFEKKWTAVLARLAIEAQIRPVGPLFIRLYGGFGATDVSRRVHGAAKITGRVGGTYGVAVGWELYPGHDPRRSGGLAVAPFVFFEASPDSTFASLAVGVGFEITWWTGLSKNELVLPDDEAFSKE